MIAQLSTSATTTQLTFAQAAQLLALWLLSFGCANGVWAQASEIERRIDPLSAIDRQFMADQRARVESLANRMGRTLTGRADRDIDTLQKILDQGWVATDDTLTLQAMGVVFGDLLADELSMDWVVYRDRAGRSRALHYPNTDTYLFPVTMISRRVAAGSPRPLADLYKVTARETRQRLPGGRWMQ